MMKRTKLFLTFFLCLLFVIPFIGLTAGKETYVGINTGDEFIWRYTVYTTVNAQYLAETNGDLSFDSSLQGYRIIIGAINEQSVEQGFNAVKINITAYNTTNFNSGSWQLDTTMKTSYIQEYNSSIYKIIIDNGPLFIANNVNWGELASALRNFLSPLVIGTYSVFIEGNGLRIIVQATGSSEVNSLVQYTAEGVLETFDVKYGGAQMVLIKLQGIIPGYPHELLLGISIIFFLGLTYQINKKKGKK